MRLLALSLCLSSTLLSGAAHAAFLTVTSPNDDGAGSLREALLDAASGDVIVFALPGAPPYTIDLDSPLGVKQNVSILGPGSASLTIRRAAVGQQTVFDIDVGIVAALSGMTIADGAGAKGGCIRHAGASLSLSSVVVRNCTATDTVDPRGGGLFVEPSAGALTVAGSRFVGCAASIGAGIAVNDGTTDTLIEDSDFEGNSATIAGGGIYHGGEVLRLVRARFDGNLSAGGNAGGGGALYVSASAGTTEVSQSSFVDNTSTGDPSFGGGIAAIHLTAAKSLTVDSSLFVGNAAQIGAGVATGQTTMTARIVNCTFAANLGSGAAVFASSPTASVALYVDASTFVGNTVGVNAITQNPNQSSYVVLRNTILANVTNVAGAIYSLGNNLVTAGGPGFNADDLVTVDPLLGTLADNGGPTLTFAPQPTSPAIDAGRCASIAPIFPDVLTVDQRGTARDDGACDIGAYESVVLPTGPQGPAGPAGPTGPTGPQGPSGNDGVDGADGLAGADGADGTDGANGAAEADGGCAATSTGWLAVAAIAGLLVVSRSRARWCRLAARGSSARASR